MSTRLFITALASLTLAAPATAGDDPYSRADGTWISIDGSVDAVSADSFVLDYGNGMITVEMDDGDRDADGYALLRGDKVTVSGTIDDDFFETTTIEAGSVYVEKIDTYFFASALDEEGPWYDHTYLEPPVIISATVLRGTVSSVSDDEFTLDTGLREMTVSVDGMPYNPLDDEGYQRIEKGDRVQVTGHLDHDLFEGRELEARSVMTLHSTTKDHAQRTG